MDIKELLHLIETTLNESPNLKTKDTGLPILLYVSKQQGSHGARVKFLNKYSTSWDNSDSISITIEDEPKVVAPKNYKLKIKTSELNDVKAWIKLNKEPLLDFWYGRIELPELKKNLTKLN